MKRRVQRGFTLVEVMIATMVFTMGILGVYAMMIKSYELVTLSRHRDNARALLLSFSDQFLRLQTTDQNPLPNQPPILRPLFNTTGAGSDGLAWTDSMGVHHTPNAGDPYFTVLLGDSGDSSVGSQVPARVSRTVTYVDTAGVPAGSAIPAAAGWLLQGTFTISYEISGKTQTQSITVARSVR